jgi:hypothetical protein
MTRSALVALGVSQCVSWGVLYYAFAALLLPMATDLHAPPWIVTGAFSLALLIAAAMAPVVGRWSDRGLARPVMLTGGVASAALLAASALATSAAHLYLVWAGLGICMAATLYEPAFAIVGRSHADAATRLRALALVTIFGGLASTVFLPVTGWLVHVVGWRRGVVVLAGLVALSTLAMCFLVFATQADTAGPAAGPAMSSPAGTAVGGSRIGPLVLVFAFASFSAAAVVANIVPALAEHGLTTTAAAAMGGVFGVMQLPGRALLFHGRLDASPVVLLAVSLGLQAAGLLVWGLWSWPLTALAGLAVFAVGSGLGTLVRPFLVQTAFGLERAGRLNGRIALGQQLARALGPVLIGAVASAIGYRLVFLSLGATFTLLAWSSLRRSSPSASPEFSA